MIRLLTRFRFLRPSRTLKDLDRPVNGPEFQLDFGLTSDLARKDTRLPGHGGCSRKVAPHLIPGRGRIDFKPHVRGHNEPDPPLEPPAGVRVPGIRSGHE